mgnify:CR=1 FL=1
MNEYINLTLENIDNEHICCAIGDKKHQVGVDMKKAWIKNKLKIGFESSKLVNLQSKGIIYLIESKIRPDNSSTALLGFNNYSLEHLMPKNWRKEWKAYYFY